MNTAADVLAGRAAWAVDVADALAWLRALPGGCAQACVTSPPYYGLRDYRTARWEGGDPACGHRAGHARQDGGRANVDGFHGSGVEDSHKGEVQYRHVCGKCGARRVDAQIGTEDTPQAHVARLVEVFGEVRRVLRGDGVLLLNLGDSYAGGKTGRTDRDSLVAYDVRRGNIRDAATSKQERATFAGQRPVPPGLKPKDLIGVPWMAAFALRESGWYLRSEMIWHKLAPMPESVRDRPTKAHEQVFLLAKQGTYFWDAEAVKQPVAAASIERAEAGFRTTQRDVDTAAHSVGSGTRKRKGLRETFSLPPGANLRSVLTLGPESCDLAHFAVMPTALASICVRAATSARGACPACGAPWRRVTKKSHDVTRPQTRRAVELAERAGLTEAHFEAIRAAGISDTGKALTITNGAGRNREDVQRLADEARAILGGYYREFLLDKAVTTGWHPSCTCPPAEPLGALVIDPFAGSGTTGVVCRQLGRRFLGCDLNPAYADIARRRIGDANPLGDFWVSGLSPAPPRQPSLFGEEAAP